MVQFCDFGARAFARADSARSPLSSTVNHTMPKRCQILEELQVKRHEAIGPVRQFRWSHANRQDILVFVETTKSRAIQMIFGSQFDHQQTGYHGDFFELNRTTIFMRGIRYSGIHAEWTHNLTFLKMADSETQQWHCMNHPIIITELDDDSNPIPHSSAPSSLSSLPSSSSSVPSSSASSSSSYSASASASAASSASHPYNSMTWEQYVARWCTFGA